MTQSPWPRDCDHAKVRGWIEEASDAALSVDDSQPDTFIAVAQSLGLGPRELKTWIYDLPKPEGWTAAALARWARTLGLARETPE